ncbi:MAG: hypothetical protein ACR2IP_13120 [Solirubrobacteraceae bacterium]
MRDAQRLPTTFALCAAILALSLLGVPTPARASTGQQAILQDDSALMRDPVQTLQRLRLLGVGTVRVALRWQSVAPATGSHQRPRGFRAADAAAYPARNWAPYDEIVKDARLDGITVLFDVVGGGPLWADAPGAPRDKRHPEWMPSAREFGSFVTAIGTRYSGRYTPAGSPSPLPRVHFWSIWNEPNFGQDLAPQAIKGSTISVAPGRYRDLVDAAWSAFHATGHGGDQILIGDLAPRGLTGRTSRHHPQGLPGNFGQTKPLQFIRTLYCVDSSYREYRGTDASARGCPTTLAGSRRFRGAHPGLFQARGFGIHPYPQDLPPTEERSHDPDFAAFPELPHLEAELDRLQRMYGSGTRFAIYNDEYGYLTNPPTRGRFVSPATAAYYLNWAEYLSWRSPRIASTMQYLLYDPLHGDYASGLLFRNGREKPAYSAYRLPLYLPVTSTGRGHGLEVWGAVRPARFASTGPGGGPQGVQIQFQSASGRAFRTLRTVPITDPHGYFDVRMTFPSSGTVRLAWIYPVGPTHAMSPTRPVGDPLPPPPGSTAYSRDVRITMR